MDPGTLQYGLGSLTRGTSYALQVMASTRAGGTNGTRINFKTLSISECLIPAPAGLLGFSQGVREGVPHHGPMGRDLTSSFLEFLKAEMYVICSTHQLLL